MANIELIKQKILELESKLELTKSETFKLARYRVILNNPEIEKERYRKIVETRRNKTQKEKNITSKKHNKNLKKRWAGYKKDPVKMIEISNRASKNAKEKNPMRTQEARDKVSKALKGRKMTGDRLLKQQEVISNLHNTYGNPGFKVKKYHVGKYIVQGKTEKLFLEKLITEGKELPFLKKKYIKTPFGYYHPDFEYKDKYVEIKSIYTYNIFIGTEIDSDGEFSTQQMQKIIWVGKNIKPVELYIVINKDEIKTIIFNSNYDDSNFEFIPKKIIREKLSKEERARIAKEVGLKQRGKIISAEHINSIKEKVKNRKENNYQEHRNIYDRANQTKKEKWNSLTLEEQTQIKEKRRIANILKWQKIKENQEQYKDIMLRRSITRKLNKV